MPVLALSGRGGVTHYVRSEDVIVISSGDKNVSVRLRGGGGLVLESSTDANDLVMQGMSLRSADATPIAEKAVQL